MSTETSQTVKFNNFHNHKEAIRECIKLNKELSLSQIKSNKYKTLSHSKSKTDRQFNKSNNVSSVKTFKLNESSNVTKNKDFIVYFNLSSQLPKSNRENGKSAQENINRIKSLILKNQLSKQQNAKKISDTFKVIKENISILKTSQYLQNQQQRKVVQAQELLNKKIILNKKIHKQNLIKQQESELYFKLSVDVNKKKKELNSLTKSLSLADLKI